MPHELPTDLVDFDPRLRYHALYHNRSHDLAARQVGEQHGYLAETMDSSLASGSPTQVAGTLILARIYNPRAAVCVGVVIIVNTAGATFSNTNKIALFADDGSVKMVETADQAAAWASTGAKTTLWTAPQQLAADTWYRIVILASATTMPVFRAGQATAGTTNAGLTGAAIRGGTGATGQTTIPATVDAAAQTSAALLTLMLI